MRRRSFLALLGLLPFMPKPKAEGKPEAEGKTVEFVSGLDPGELPIEPVLPPLGAPYSEEPTKEEWAEWTGVEMPDGKVIYWKHYHA